jgi:hypothetical protein
MKFQFITFALVTLFVINAFALNISIENDKTACTEGQISMDVRVRVESETFNFDPSCGFSFDQNFTTKDGIECEVHAGMCTVFSPSHKFVVECDHGMEDESIVIDCLN